MIEITPHESLALAARGWPRGREGARRDNRTRLALGGFSVRGAADGAAAGAGGGRPAAAGRRARGALARRWLFDGPGRDAWIYYGYFRFARVYLEEAASAYYSSRLSVIL